MKKTTKKSAADTKSAATIKPASAPKAPAKKTPTAAVPAKKKAAVQTEPPATFISARADIGFGNHLYLRGEGPGLSWDHGLALDCVAADLWSATLKGATAPVTFKVLVNDISWSTGSDYVVEPGQSVTIVPTF
ncbi:MAG: hypothetical protein ACHQ5A_03140 [Opitutales bacterium]